jgi:hypothetical protein
MYLGQVTKLRSLPASTRTPCLDSRIINRPVTKCSCQFSRAKPPLDSCIDDSIVFTQQPGYRWSIHMQNS